MFPLTPDQHHWLEVATEDEGCLYIEKFVQKYKVIFVKLQLSLPYILAASLYI